jgi:uncharacterized membrane protein
MFGDRTGAHFVAGVVLVLAGVGLSMTTRRTGRQETQR